VAGTLAGDLRVADDWADGSGCATATSSVRSGAPRCLPVGRGFPFYFRTGAAAPPRGRCVSDGDSPFARGTVAVSAPAAPATSAPIPGGCDLAPPRRWDAASLRGGPEPPRPPEGDPGEARPCDVKLWPSSSRGVWGGRSPTPRDRMWFSTFCPCPFPKTSSRVPAERPSRRRGLAPGVAVSSVGPDVGVELEVLPAVGPVPAHPDRVGLAGRTGASPYRQPIRGDSLSLCPALWFSMRGSR